MDGLGRTLAFRALLLCALLSCAAAYPTYYRDRSKFSGYHCTHTPTEAVDDSLMSMPKGGHRVAEKAPAVRFLLENVMTEEFVTEYEPGATYYLKVFYTSVFRSFIRTDAGNFHDSTTCDGLTVATGSDSMQTLIWDSPPARTGDVKFAATVATGYSSAFYGNSITIPEARPSTAIVARPEPEPVPPNRPVVQLGDEESSEVIAPKDVDCEACAAGALRTMDKVDEDDFWSRVYRLANLPQDVDKTAYEERCTKVLKRKQNRTWIKYRKKQWFRRKGVPYDILVRVVSRPDDLLKLEDFDCIPYADRLLTEKKIRKKEFFSLVLEGLELLPQLDSDPYLEKCEDQMKTSKRFGWRKGRVWKNE